MRLKNSVDLLRFSAVSVIWCVDILITAAVIMDSLRCYDAWSAAVEN